MTSRIAPSITRRLTVTLTAFIAGFWLIATALAMLVMHHELDQSLDSSLQEAAQRLLTLAVENGVGTTRPADTAVRQRQGGIIVKHDEYLTYQVRDRSGQVLLRSHDAPEKPFTSELEPGFVNTEAQRVFTEATADGAVFIQVAETHAHRHEALWESGMALVLPILLLAPLSAWVIRRIVYRGMSPMISIQREISDRGAGNLTAIEDAGIASELAPITAAVNTLIERLRFALEAERAFASNSAHEMRTPLAAALAQVQRLQAQLTDASHKERAAGIARDLRRLVDLTEKLLQLSRAESGTALTLGHRETDLMPILELIVDDMAHGARAAGRSILIERAANEIVSRLDVDAFGIVTRNLIENALNHGDGGEPVVVRVEPNLRLTVVNGGRVVPAATLEGLKRRFTRGATTANGAGLGLAIADTILRQSGGRLELRSPATGRTDGFEAIVDLGTER